MTKPKVFIGIAAYNSEKNIKNLLSSLMSQVKDNWILEKILVHCDACIDQTVNRAKSIKSTYIEVEDNKNRRGFSGSVKFLLSRSSSDITLLLNDDILIQDPLLVEKLISEFTDQGIGLVTGRPVPLKAKTFIEHAVTSSLSSHERALYETGNIHNIYTCDGKVLCLSRQFVLKLVPTLSTAHMGNVDSFLYLSCISFGFKYRHSQNALVHFQAPSNLKDWIKLTSRNNADALILKHQFGSLTDRAWTHPSRTSLLKFKIIEALKNPLGSAIIFIMSFYCQYKSHTHFSWLSPTWEVIGSTKKYS